jgi:predicted regulator of Ras-like GTPase activity (Roadblock/LC7/MglB family)
MQDLLAQITRVRGVGGALVISADGLSVASSLRVGIEEGLLAASAGDLVGSLSRITTSLKLGTPTTFTGTSEQGALLVIAAGPAWLVMLAEQGANLALLQIEVRPLIDRLAGRLAL